MPRKKKTEKKKPGPREKKATTRMVLRLPESIADANAGDWSGLREVLDRWAKKGTGLEVEYDPPRQVCFSVGTETAEAIREEAERLTEETGQQWTASMVVARVWAEAL